MQIRDILDRWNYVVHLEERKSEVLRSIADQGKLTEETDSHLEGDQITRS